MGENQFMNISDLRQTIHHMLTHTISKKFSREFRSWNRKLFLYDTTAIVLIFSFFSIFRPDYVVLAAYLFIIFYLVATKRKILVYHLAVSSVLAFVWVFLAEDYYYYNYDFITLADLNLFPILAWATGLLGVYAIYRQHRYFPEAWGFGKHLFLFTVFFWILLIFAETIAYHFFNVKLVSAVYEGLPVCDCLHAPLAVKVIYFLMGPLFFIIAYLLGLERPHIKAS